MTDSDTSPIEAAPPVADGEDLPPDVPNDEITDGEDA